MNKVTLIRAAAFFIALAIAFGSGYFISEYQNGQAMESMVYTDLLTDTRARLRAIDAIDSKHTSDERQRLVSELRSRVAMLEQFKETGKLGSEGVGLLEKAKKYVESQSKK